MNVISEIALAIVIGTGMIWLYFRLERWWCERRVRQIHDEVVRIGREAGMSDSELETYCDGCKRFSVGPVCPYC